MKHLLDCTVKNRILQNKSSCFIHAEKNYTFDYMDQHQMSVQSIKLVLYTTHEMQYYYYPWLKAAVV